jgi:hypothetical protein
MDEQNLIVILQSIHHVLRAEKVLKKAGTSFDLIPVPREISSDCGMAVAVNLRDKTSVCENLSRAQISIEALYRRTGESFEEIC